MMSQAEDAAPAAEMVDLQPVEPLGLTHRVAATLEKERENAARARTDARAPMRLNLTIVNSLMRDVAVALERAVLGGGMFLRALWLESSRPQAIVVRRDGVGNGNPRGLHGVAGD